MIIGNCVKKATMVDDPGGVPCQINDATDDDDVGS